MTADSIAGEQLIVVVLLKPGWEKNYHGDPPVHETATLGHIVQYNELPEGKYDILLEGVERVRLVEGPEDPISSGRLYRVSWINGASEEAPPSGSSLVSEKSLGLRSLWQKLVDEIGLDVDGLEEGLCESDSSFETLVNQIASNVDLPPAKKQFLLEQNSLLERAQILESALTEQILVWGAVKRFRARAPSDPRVN
jgi:Lon protease-like protein